MAFSGPFFTGPEVRPTQPADTSATPNHTGPVEEAPSTGSSSTVTPENSGQELQWTGAAVDRSCSGQESGNTSQEATARYRMPVQAHRDITLNWYIPGNPKIIQ
ncbi:uncharacterized protein LOC126942118 isoform X2 [Macaca thibetana thibetana]|uniref:uncharacterized protein LOC126942118 isoform X2 n=1 Tax=Macaca thibetana thibetana TaxID=257877 RepID=UPI0021BCB88A|nr:uncharacterized protein LOC126942118 isoform X2 [Macaca thibetana thibetana]